jgi:hypothetical protein
MIPTGIPTHGTRKKEDDSHEDEGDRDSDHATLAPRTLRKDN